jgi:GNAT superfamily N-acetyltransferase
MDQSIRIVRADLDDPRHARAIVEQLDDFARDPVGGESPLPPETRERRKEERCRGVGLALLEAVEARARELGCCKLTLEVHEENVHARRLYDRFGFEELRVGEQARRTFFIEKPLGTR